MTSGKSHRTLDEVQLLEKRKKTFKERGANAPLLAAVGVDVWGKNSTCSSSSFPLSQQEHSFITKLTPTKYSIAPGFVPNMRVPGCFYVNDSLKTLVDDELADSVARAGESGGKAGGGFLPAVKQVANVAALPGIVGASLAMPDLHSGYGFAIGNVAAFDTSDSEAVVSPGGVGFDINCGVRLLRTNLTEAEVSPLREQLAQSLFDHIPVGVGSQGIIPTTAADLDGEEKSFLFFVSFFEAARREKLQTHFFFCLLFPLSLSLFRCFLFEPHF